MLGVRRKPGGNRRGKTGGETGGVRSVSSFPKSGTARVNPSEFRVRSGHGARRFHARNSGQGSAALIGKQVPARTRGGANNGQHAYRGPFQRSRRVVLRILRVSATKSRKMGNATDAPGFSWFFCGLVFLRTPLVFLTSIQPLPRASRNSRNRLRLTSIRWPFLSSASPDPPGKGCTSVTDCV